MSAIPFRYNLNRDASDSPVGDFGISSKTRASAMDFDKIEESLLFSTVHLEVSTLR